MKHILIVGELDPPIPQADRWSIQRVFSFREAIATIRTERFDSIIVDSATSGRDGIFLAPSIKRNSPASTALLITEEKLWAITEAAMQLGFDEVLSTQVTQELLNKQINEFLTREIRGINSKLESKIHRLSLREREILIDISTGATTLEIARKRHNSEATIKSHLSSIYRKLEVRNRVEAIAQINS